MSCNINIQHNLFSNDELDIILGLPEVQNAKRQIDSKSNGSIYFSINLTPEQKVVLQEFIGKDISNLASIPMRWIKGDMKPHIDTGIKSFDNTHLVYITDSEGELVIDDESYPICKGSAYSFSEGLMHETIGTGVEPRLLLGPMSDTGFAVGYTGIYGPGGSTIYIRQISTDADIEYSIDNNDNNNENWNTIYWPVPIMNTNVVEGFLKIEFTTDITISSINQYFQCDPFINAGYIQFGSSSLKSNGTRPIITINEITDYPGLIQNGSSESNGNNNIRVFNLDVRAINSTLYTSESYEAGGWIGQCYWKGCYK
jgi:hypothetical protein